MCDLSMESLQSAETALPPMELGMADILDAEARLQRFAPFIRERFPETAPRGGLIESPLTPIPRMQRLLEERFGAVIPGRLLLKQDSHLAIAGSVKARGGIYEVLKHTEELAMENGLLSETDDYAKLASPGVFQPLYSPGGLHRKPGPVHRHRFRRGGVQGHRPHERGRKAVEKGSAPGPRRAGH